MVRVLASKVSSRSLAQALTLSLGELVDVELVVVPALLSSAGAQAVPRAATATTAVTQARVRRERRGVMRPIVGTPSVPKGSHTGNKLVTATRTGYYQGTTHLRIT